MLKSNKKNNNMLTPVTTTIEKYEFGQDDDDDELRNNDDNNEGESDEPLTTDNTVSFQVTIAPVNQIFLYSLQSKAIIVFFLQSSCLQSN